METDMENIKLCPGCMRELPQNRIKDLGKDTARCPYCGFCPSEYQQNPRCLPPDTILAGKYLVGKVLGEGGFGITYMGYDLNMKTRVAIKEYFPVELVTRDTTRRMAGGGQSCGSSAPGASVSGGNGLSAPGVPASDSSGLTAGGISSSGGGSDRVISLSGEKSKTYQQGLKKYVDEARNVSQFADIPGIVSVKDFFYENNTAYIVMEYIEGISLKEYLKQKGGKVSEEEALAILRPVLEALEKVHAAGIVHRDISPDNIMLTFTEEGKAGAGQSGVSAVYGNISAVKLIDFGAARMTSKNDQKSLTIILKHGYAPEEQYRSHGEQGPWTDVYALCAVLYRMLTGKVPESAMDRLFSDELKRPEELGAKVSQTMSEAIMRGLAVKKEERIQSVRELMDALYQGKPVGKAGKKWFRYSIFAAAAAGVLLLGVIMVQVANRPQEMEAVRQTEETAEMAEGAEETGSAGAAEQVETNAGEASEAAGREETVLPPTEEYLVLEEKEELGEQIVFPSAQTAISCVRQAHTLFRMPDGHVKALGSNRYGQCMVENWEHVAAVSASSTHSLGLRSDGKVYAVGENSYGQCDTGGWHDIVAIAAGESASFGLRADGTVEACGNVKFFVDEISTWENIRAIATAPNRSGVIGLDENGNCRFAGFWNDLPQITGWEDVEWISCGALQGLALVGIRENGGLVRAQLEEDSFGHFTGVENWTEVKQFSANTPALGVRQDGTAMFLESADPELKETLRTWTDLEALTSAYIFDELLVFGLQVDGTILEYRENHGNSEPAEMTDLKWIQVVAEGQEDSLVALNEEGKLLTYGIYIPSFYTEIENRGTASLIGAGGLIRDGYLYEDGTFHGWDRANEAYTWWTEDDILQAAELWGGAANDVWSEAFALLTRDGRVEIRETHDTVDGVDLWSESEIRQASQAEAWTNVIQILGIDGKIYGLHRDGTVSTTVEENRESLQDVSNVEKIAGYIGGQHGLEDVLALEKDGTVELIVAGERAVEMGRTQVQSWTGIEDIAVGESHVAGLLSDGTVIAAGSNHAGQCDVENWGNIIYLTAGRNCTIGITADGELKMAGSLY